VKKQVNKYTKALLSHVVYFPEGREVCRFCPFCVTSGFNHRRESCLITGTILPCADISIEGNCPLRFEGASIEENFPSFFENEVK
jgi:hypothetical protein